MMQIQKTKFASINQAGVRRILFLILLAWTAGFASTQARSQEFDRFDSSAVQPVLSQPLQWVSVNVTTAPALPQAFEAMPEAWAFAPYTHSTILPTANGQDVWAKFSLAPASTPQSWIIRIARVSIGKVSLYSLDANGAWAVQSAGVKIAPSSWNRTTRTPSFEVLTSHTGKTYYLRFENPSPVTERPELMSNLDFSDGTSVVGTLTGLMLGTFGFLILACMASFVVARNTVFLALAALTASALFNQLVSLGYGAWRIWPESAYLNQSMQWAAPLWTMATGCWFFAQASHAKDSHRRIYLLLAGLAAASVCLSVIALIAVDQLPRGLFNFWAGAILAVVALSQAWLAWRGTRWNRWLFAGLLPLAGVSVTRVLYNHGWLSHIESAQFAGIVFIQLSLMLFFLVLAWRSRDLLLSAELAKGLTSSDPVSGLINARVALIRLRQMLLRSDRLKLGCGVIMLRWVYFRKLKSTQKPEQLHALTKQFAHILTKLIRDIDTASVLGGGNFMLLIEGPITRSALASLSTQILTNCIRASEKFDLPNAFQMHIAIWQPGMAPGTAGKVMETLKTRLDQMLINTRRPVQFLDSLKSEAEPDQGPEQEFGQRRDEMLAKINAIEASPGFRAPLTDKNPKTP